MLNIDDEMSKSNITFITIQNKFVLACVFCFIHRLFVHLRMRMSTSKQQSENKTLKRY